MEPHVTVVVPTHNRRALVTQTMRTVLWQRDVDLEVIVVDDGSSDGTEDVIAGLSDPRVRLLRNDKPAGVSVARNLGAAAGRGEWLAFCDDDDLWAPDKLHSQLAAASDSGCRWAYAGQINVSMDLRVVGGAPPLEPDALLRRLPHSNVVPGGGSGVVLHRDVAPSPLFDSGYQHFADWDLWLRLARNGPPAWVPRPLVGYRVHAGARSMDTEGMVAELDMIGRRHGGPVDRAAFYRHVARVSLRADRRRDALGYYLRAAADGRRGEAVMALGRDLGGLVADAVVQGRRHAGRRWRQPWLESPARTQTDPRHQAWRSQGEAWVSRLR